MQRRKPIRVPPFAQGATGVLARLTADESRRWLKATIESAWRAAGHSDVLVTVEPGSMIRTSNFVTSIVRSNLMNGLPPSLWQG